MTIRWSSDRAASCSTRLILPNGRPLVLGKLPAGDPARYAGLQDRVDHHWRDLFGMAALATVLGVGAELGQSDGDSDIVRALRTGASGTLNSVGQQAVGRDLSVPPTLTIRPGAPVRVIVTRDLVLEPFRS
jgi:type IV secretory pathway VirB10-like protein